MVSFVHIWQYHLATGTAYSSELASAMHVGSLDLFSRVFLFSQNLFLLPVASSPPHRFRFFSPKDIFGVSGINDNTQHKLSVKG